MIPMDLNWIASVLAVSFEGQNQQVLNINTDTRTIKAGEVFLAIKGPNFDGHKFVEQAVAQGAVALFGDENEEVQKAIMKTQGAMSLLNGVQLGFPQNM